MGGGNRAVNEIQWKAFSLIIRGLLVLTFELCQDTLLVKMWREDVVAFMGEENKGVAP